MLRSLTTAVSGLHQFQQQMDVIGNNVANVNTTGYKSGRTDFSESFSQMVRAPGASSDETPGLPAVQVGSGVGTGAIKNLHTQGVLSATGQETDLAINGRGYFLVRDPHSDTQYATRAGDFSLDPNGYLLTNTGNRVQGYSEGSLSSIGDLKIDATGRPEDSDPQARMVTFAIDRQGMINVQLSDGSQFVRGQVLLQDFRNTQALIKEGDNLYSGLGLAGPLGGGDGLQPEAPDTNGLGIIQAGALELSNVDLANEFSGLITSQRAFQANARMITTSDEVIQEVVNLKR